VIVTKPTLGTAADDAVNGREAMDSSHLHIGGAVRMINARSGPARRAQLDSSKSFSLNRFGAQWQPFPPSSRDRPTKTNGHI
jgi:hypothetical protein